MSNPQGLLPNTANAPIEGLEAIGITGWGRIAGIGSIASRNVPNSPVVTQ
jgi:hypothetical protein